MNNTKEIIEKLSPLEIKIIPFLNLKVEEIEKKSGLDNTSVLRAIRFLENKGILKIKTETNKIISLGTNGIYYQKHGLPERILLTLLEENKHLSLEQAEKLSKLSENEFKISLGVLKKKALIQLSNGKISLNASAEEITKKSLEEQFLDILPIEEKDLQPEQIYALENLKKRKDIIGIKEKNIITFELSPIGKELAGKDIKSDLIEGITPEVIKSWSKHKKLR